MSDAAGVRARGASGRVGEGGVQPPPVMLAYTLKFRFVSIHPFDEGNGLVSRLMMNFSLDYAGYPIFDIEL